MPLLIVAEMELTRWTEMRLERWIGSNGEAPRVAQVFVKGCGLIIGGSGTSSHLIGDSDLTIKVIWIVVSGKKPEDRSSRSAALSILIPKGKLCRALGGLVESDSLHCSAERPVNRIRLACGLHNLLSAFKNDSGGCYRRGGLDSIASGTILPIDVDWCERYQLDTNKNAQTTVVPGTWCDIGSTHN